MLIVKSILSKVRGILLCVGLLAAPAHAQNYDLVLSHFFQADSGFQEEMIDPWVQQLHSRSGGRISVRVHGAETWLGNVAHQYDQVSSGLVDIAFGHTGIPRGQFTCTNITDLPFLVDSGQKGNVILHQLFPEFLQHEFRHVKMLALIAPEPGVLLTRDHPISRPEELNGLKIGVPSPNIARLFSDMGAETVTLAPIQVHERFASGQIDGLLMPWWGVSAFKLDEVAQYVLEMDAYSVPAFMIMNKHTYETMPGDLQAVLDSLSSTSLYESTGGTWNVAMNRAQLTLQIDRMRNDFIARGGEVRQLKADLRQDWLAAADGTITEIEAELSEACGADLIARARELSAAGD